jgi:hypothetical protein
VKVIKLHNPTHIDKMVELHDELITLLEKFDELPRHDFVAITTNLLDHALGQFQGGIGELSPHYKKILDEGGFDERNQVQD